MELNEILKIGEVCEVSGKTIKAGIYSNKNTEYLNFNGQIIKNVSINSFVLIRKGFSNIIGKVEGEYIKEAANSNGYSEKGKNINRIISISILGALEKDNFIHGLVNLPMVGNYVYIVTEEVVSKIFARDIKDKILLGTLIGYDSYPFEVGVQDLICSHIGIFGNTGSGKSNTLAKIYYEVNEKYKDREGFINSKFVLFDFNGEYSKLFKEADVYTLSTRDVRKRVRYPIGEDDLFDLDFWSIIFEATDKTQKPFVERAIRKFKQITNKKHFLDYDKLAELIFNASEKYIETRFYIREIFDLLDMLDNFNNFQDTVMYNSKLHNYYIYNGNYTDYNIDKEKIYEVVFGDDDNESIDIMSLNKFQQFALSLYIQYCEEIIKTFITKEHIGPLMARTRNRIDSLNKIFKVVENDTARDTNIEIISLIGLKVDMRKIVPLLICKKLYNKKKEEKRNQLNTSLHLIIDEAHNILSTTSIRESEEWKDYRLECFEEIIKEGRKFGTYLTIASQRPSDISDTIISQLHNYFIHRLVNEEDLRKIYKTISFSDKASNEMIPILPAGGCIFSGLATNFPILARISILPQRHQPTSENVVIEKIWK